MSNTHPKASPPWLLVAYQDYRKVLPFLAKRSRDVYRNRGVATVSCLMCEPLLTEVIRGHRLATVTCLGSPAPPRTGLHLQLVGRIVGKAGCLFGWLVGWLGRTALSLSLTFEWIHLLVVFLVGWLGRTALSLSLLDGFILVVFLVGWLGRAEPLSLSHF